MIMIKSLSFHQEISILISDSIFVIQQLCIYFQILGKQLLDDFKPNLSQWYHRGSLLDFVSHHVWDFVLLFGQFSYQYQSYTYIPSTINISRNLLSTTIWAENNRLISGRLPCISSKTLKIIAIKILILFFQFSLECIFK